jgi:hypothetical protein
MNEKQIVKALDLLKQGDMVVLEVEYDGGWKIDDIRKETFKAEFRGFVEGEEHVGYGYYPMFWKEGDSCGREWEISEIKSIKKA